MLYLIMVIGLRSKKFCQALGSDSSRIDAKSEGI
jgi:hypothetical protein